MAAAILVGLSTAVGSAIYMTSLTGEAALDELDRLASVQILAQRTQVLTLELMHAQTEGEEAVARLALEETSRFLAREGAVTFEPSGWFARQLYAYHETTARKDAYASHGSRLLFLGRKAQAMADSRTALDREFTASVIRAQTRSDLLVDLNYLVGWHKNVLRSAILLVELVQLIAVPVTALTLLSIWYFLVLPMRRREVETTSKLRTREAEARELAARAMAANESKSDFLAVMSHEIRTPMNGVLGLAEVLDGSLESPENRHTLQALKESGQLMVRVLNDILDFTRIDSGKLQLEAAPFRPSDLARDIEALYRPQAIERGLDFNVHVSLRAESLWTGDAHRVTQILNNLVSNAIKFTQSGRVDLVISIPDDGLLIDVSDTGIGMSRSQVDAIFEWFAQADSSIARRFGGTGLGMSIVRKLVDAMAGTIQVESTPDTGTRIEVYLPLQPAPENAATAAPLEAAPPLPSTLRVLAADDIATNRMVIRKMLEELGLAPDIVPGGQEAIDACAARSYDILLLDIAMPDVDGLQALREIRAQATARGHTAPPALAVTANSLPAQINRYLEGGFAGHLPKPVDGDRLATEIHRQIKESTTASDAA